MERQHAIGRDQCGGRVEGATPAEALEQQTAQHGPRRCAHPEARLRARDRSATRIGRVHLGHQCQPSAHQGGARCALQCPRRKEGLEAASLGKSDGRGGQEQQRGGEHAPRARAERERTHERCTEQLRGVLGGEEARERKRAGVAAGGQQVGKHRHEHEQEQHVVAQGAADGKDSEPLLLWAQQRAWQVRCDERRLHRQGGGRGAHLTVCRARWCEQQRDGDDPKHMYMTLGGHGVPIARDRDLPPISHTYIRSPAISLSGAISNVAICDISYSHQLAPGRNPPGPSASGPPAEPGG